ncbi:folate receptor beta-like [Ornithodoros turicata]|uniref:folate receptor beta-like n=1 Tax=Ornithodoros turicata TaxID=34597 RepID=UPI00313938AE
MKAVVFFVYYLLQISAGQKVCMDGRNHKAMPGPEDDLHGQCTPWKKEACCTGNTTRAVHNTNMYNFTYDFCETPMSDACRRHFRRDLCFYECEPNLKPWIVKVNRKIAKERFFEVPLCQSDCDAWWNDCRQDLACVRNWAREFRWKKGNNRCPGTTGCQKFEELYSGASDFCSEVWDHSWKVVPDEQPCMRIWFNGSRGNPNEAVAKLYTRSSSAPVSQSLLSTILFSTPLCLLCSVLRLL